MNLNKSYITVRILQHRMRRLGKHLYLALFYAFKDMGKMHAADFAGNMSFLYTLGLMPFIMLIIYITASIGEKTLGLQTIQLFLQKIPDNISNIVAPVINEVTSNSAPELLGVASLSMLWSASAIVEGLRSILNQVYRVRNTPNFIWRRISSMLEFLLIISLILGSMFFIVILPRLVQQVFDLLEISLTMNQVPSDSITFLLLFFLLALLYYVIPNISQNFLSILPATIITTTGWTLLSKLFGNYVQYINRLNYIYGGLFSIVILELFLYLLNLIFIFGALFNYHLLALYDRLPTKQSHRWQLINHQLIRQLKNFNANKPQPSSQNSSTSNSSSHSSNQA